MDRQFDLARNPPGDFRKRYLVRCCKCDLVATVNSNKSSSLPFVVIERKFIERGWYIGAEKHQDLCSQHAHTRRDREKQQVAVDKEKLNTDRVLTTMRSFEDALVSYSALENPSSAEQVMTALQQFHGRVFGDA